MEAFFIMTQNQRSARMPIVSRSTALAARNADTYDRPIILTALKGGLFGLGATALTGALLITGSTAVAYAMPDSTAIIPFFAIPSVLCSSFVGGFICSKAVKEAPLLCGTVTGAMITLLTLVLSLILFSLPSSGYEFWQSAALHMATLAFSVLGAFAGNIKMSRRKGKRRFK